jgi:hypothetical protein
MEGVHSLGFDLSLFGALLNPLRTASGAKGATRPAHQEDHPLGLADRATRHRHLSLPLLACLNFQVHPSGQGCPSGRCPGRGTGTPKHSVGDRLVGRYGQSPHLRPRSKGCIALRPPPQIIEERLPRRRAMIKGQSDAARIISNTPRMPFRVLGLDLIDVPESVISWPRVRQSVPSRKGPRCSD